LWAGTSSGSLATWPKRALRRWLMVLSSFYTILWWIKMIIFPSFCLWVKRKCPILKNMFQPTGGAYSALPDPLAGREPHHSLGLSGLALRSFGPRSTSPQFWTVNTDRRSICVHCSELGRRGSRPEGPKREIIDAYGEKLRDVKHNVKQVIELYFNLT